MVLAAASRDDLRFTADEAAALRREATGGELPGPAVAARTEGWAVGLRLAAFHCAGRRIRPGWRRPSAAATAIFWTTWPRRRSTASRRRCAGLLQISVLGRLSGGLCDAVTGCTDSQAMLQHVEEAGLFLVPLDDVRCWWRYQQLFGDLLRARLRQEQPGRIPGAAP